MARNGTVEFLNTFKGYGFNQPDKAADGRFLHMSVVQAAGMQKLVTEQRLKYDIEKGRKGMARAVHLSAAD